MLRLLANDIPIDMRYTKHDSISVDTPEDRLRIEKIIKDREAAKQQAAQQAAKEVAEAQQQQNRPPGYYNWDSEIIRRP